MINRRIAPALACVLFCALPGISAAVTIPAGATLQGTGTTVPNQPVSLLNPDGTQGTLGSLALTTTNASGTITSGGTFQSILASSATRKGCLIQNPTTATEPLYVFFGANGSATTANSISLGPGASVSCAVGGLGVATDNVSATATTTSHAYVEMSQ